MTEWALPPRNPLKVSTPDLPDAESSLGRRDLVPGLCRSDYGVPPRLFSARAEGGTQRRYHQQEAAVQATGSYSRRP
jgi:hypothetical protein